MTTINVSIKEFQEKWESLSEENNTYFNNKTGAVAVLKYEDDEYFVLEMTNNTIRVDSVW